MIGAFSMGEEDESGEDATAEDGDHMDHIYQGFDLVVLFALDVFLQFLCHW